MYGIGDASNIVLLLLLGSTTADPLVLRSYLNRPQMIPHLSPFCSLVLFFGNASMTILLRVLEVVYTPGAR